MSYFPMCMVQNWLQSYVRAETSLVAQPVGVVIQQTHGEHQLLIPGWSRAVKAVQVFWEHAIFLVKLNLLCFEKGDIGSHYVCLEKRGKSQGKAKVNRCNGRFVHVHL